MKLVLNVPCCRDWKAAFGASLCGLIHRTTSEGINGIKLDGFAMNIMQGASVLPRARQLAVSSAIQSGATHLLCLDDDMQFPSDILDNLVKHDVDICAVNYSTKGPKPQPQTHDLEGKPQSSIGKTGLEEVAWVGFGIILIRLDAIKNIPAPLFETRWMKEKNDFVGEDYYFCGKVRAHGVKIHIDHDASNKVSHVGDYYYKEVA